MRSRYATDVFNDHAKALTTVFNSFAQMDKSSVQAQIHTSTLNIKEWLQLLTAGGLFETGKDEAAAGLESDSSLRLTEAAAIRVFIEVNLEDIQLDLSEVEENSATSDLYSEVVMDEFFYCVGALMPFSSKVAQLREAAPGVMLAELLDAYLADDFLPRFQAKPASAVAEAPASEPDEAAPSGLKPTAHKTSNQADAKDSQLNTADEWLHVAWRGGAQRAVLRQLIDEHEPGYSLSALAREIKQA